MKINKMIILAVLGILFAIPTYLRAESGHMDHSKMNHGAMDEKGEKEVTLSGKLIGLTCFLKHGGGGSNHKTCALDCAKKGLPIGLLSDGKIYQISGDGHESLVEAYKPLLKYLETNVSIMGKVFEKNGVRLLVVKKIKKG